MFPTHASDLVEAELINWLRGRLPGHANLRIGLGDDAAVLAWREREDCVVTVDLLTDGVHFVLSEAGPRRVGHKALAINLSDLAAMAARPVAAVVALALPRQGGFELAKELFEGMLPLAEQFDLTIAGGDTNSWDGPLVVSITLLGQTTSKGPLTRSGARPGDRILVTGRLGGSILGRHLDVEPRVYQALKLHERYELHAGIDVSDGLALDLSRLAAESGCGATIEDARIPVSAAAVELAGRADDTWSPLEHALGDGEDFELILAVAPDQTARILSDQPLDVPLSMIGEFTAQQELTRLTPDGRRQPLKAMGYQHRL